MAKHVLESCISRKRRMPITTEHMPKLCTSGERRKFATMEYVLESYILGKIRRLSTTKLAKDVLKSCSSKKEECLPQRGARKNCAQEMWIGKRCPTITKPKEDILRCIG